MINLIYTVINIALIIVIVALIIYPILFTAMPCEVAESHMITVF